tara:strand:- start:2437 stop:2784 length:348 start_codon:yes stop_codon:yes gene_type:complete
MDICCFSRQKSDTHYEEKYKEKYKEKSNKYLKKEKEILKQKVKCDNFLFNLYTFASTSNGIITVASKGTSSPITIPTMILTAVQAKKISNDIYEFKNKIDNIDKILNKRKIKSKL